MQSIWAIGDLHLSFGTPGKEMDVFGKEWTDHHKKVAAFWDAHVSREDLVLIPGDISWAMTLEQAIPDLEWIHARPGTKILIKGNHDYWWESASKVRKILPSTLFIISNDAFHWNSVAVAGARLWDSHTYSFTEFVAFQESSKKIEAGAAKNIEEDKKIFTRELGRLQTSINCMRPDARQKIVMTHYPPISADLQDSLVSKMLEQADVNACVFGHLHSLKPGYTLFGTKNGIQYHLVSCDWLHCTLLKIR